MSSSTSTTSITRGSTVATDRPVILAGMVGDTLTAVGIVALVVLVLGVRIIDRIIAPAIAAHREGLYSRDEVESAVRIALMRATSPTGRNVLLSDHGEETIVRATLTDLGLSRELAGQDLDDGQTILGRRPRDPVTRERRG